MLSFTKFITELVAKIPNNSAGVGDVFYIGLTTGQISGTLMYSNNLGSLVLYSSDIVLARLQTTKPGIKGEGLVEEFKKRVDLWKVKFQQALCDVGVPDTLINALPICPAGYYTIHHIYLATHFGLATCG